MSSRDIRFSSYARQDFKDILKYTRKTWGIEQQEKYKGILDNAIRMLAENPYLGKLKNQFFEGCFMYHVKRHLILYTISESQIKIVRILHDRRDVKQRLPPLN